MHKNSKNSSDKLKAKFPLTTHGYSMVKLLGSIMLSRNVLKWKQAP